MSDSPMKVSAVAVAAAGWDGLQRGRTTVVPGLLVKLAMQSLRFVPRRAAAMVSERGQRR
jgi:short-subunit dehydrogenase